MDSLGQHILFQCLQLLFMGICERQCAQEQAHTPDELTEEISSAVIRINAANLRVADNFQH